MKKLLLFLLINIALFSCSKQTPANQIVQQSANGSIEFKVNGNQVIMDNIDLLSGQYVIFQKQLKGTLIPNTRYALNAQKGVNNILLFSISADSLLKINYHNDNTFIYSITDLVLYNGQQSGMFSTGDYFDVNITDYANGKVSGTFTAKYTPLLSSVSGLAGSTVITDGKINNVQVVY